MKQMKNQLLILLLIVIVGFTLRVVGYNWDHGFHLHPDERFLTMVGNAMKVPSSIQNYLDPVKSTFNPVNIGYTNYVYGVFPVVLNKVLAVYYGNDSYSLFNLQGRILSAIFDTVSIVIVFGIARMLKKKNKLHDSIPLASAFFYSVAVLPIQLSHFFTVDTFMNMFALLSVYLGMRKRFIGSGIAYGLALACKISAVYLFPLVILALIKQFDGGGNRAEKLNKKARTALALFGITVFGVGSYLTLRLSNPYMFESVSFFNPMPSAAFVKSLVGLKQLESPTVWFPPSVQWIHKTPLFPITNLFFFGLGIPLSTLMTYGVYRVVRYHRSFFFISLLIWITGFFTFQSFQFTKNMRYFLTLYPYFAILAAIGAEVLIRPKRVRWGVGVVLLLSSLIWSLCFVRIYISEHTRVQATRWIYANIPQDKIILSEHWDDALPLPLADGKIYEIKELPVFGEDTDAKWSEMKTLMEDASYYILSSNRGWGSITTVPERYPRMAKFYNDLFAGKTEFEKVAEFTSYPLFNDDWADESFTVYDHPKVMIFKKKEAYAAAF